MKKQTKTRMLTMEYLLSYSFMMAVLLAITFLWFVYYGKSFVWYKDGYSQHYTALVYYGEYLREIIKNVFLYHRLQIPLWDMNIGYGSDIITTLHYYVVGDPLTLLSALVPKAYTEYLYTGLILLRIYLAGLSFSYFSLSHGNRQSSVLMGSACYCFCGYVLWAAVKHPYFMNPMMYLPLLLLGVDRVYQRKKPCLYILMVALAGVSNFYFLYMLGIFVILYAVVRYLEIFGRRKWREIPAWLGRFAGYSFIGIAMAAVILLPVIYSVLNTDRMGVDFYLPFLYPDKYYEDLLLNFTSGGGKYYSFLGYSAIGFLAVAVLYFSKGRNTLLKILFPVMTMFLCLPFIGHVFNGFSYKTNRWVFGYSMLVAYIVVKADFFNLKAREKKWLVFFTVLYGAVCLGLSTETEIVVRVILLVVCCFCIFAGGRFLKERGRNVLLLFLFGICGFFQAFYLYTPAGINYQKEFISSGKCYKLLFEKSPESGVCQVMEKGADCRFDRSRGVGAEKQGNGANINGAMALERHGISYYFSLDNPAVSTFLREMQLNTTSWHHYPGLDSRNILETVSSVKYFIAGEKQKAKVPKFYQNHPVYRGEGYLVYQGEEPLPIGYTYDSYIPRELYDKLSTVEKQQALLQGCVVEESSLPKNKPVFCHRIASYQMKPGEGVTIKKNQYPGCKQDTLQSGMRSKAHGILSKNCNQIQVKKKGARVTLSCQGTVPGELYVIFTGLTYQYKEKHEAKIQLKVRNGTNVLCVKNNKDNFYAGTRDFLVNMGDMNKAVTEIELIFPDKGSYTYDSLSVVSQPMDKQLEYTRQRGKEVLQDVCFSANQITGRISLQEDRLLFLSIPYSTGWRAYVNGEEVSIRQANTFGMALELKEGEHQIQLIYKTPYLGAGALLSVAGCLGFLGICVYTMGNCCNRGGNQQELQSNSC